MKRFRSLLFFLPLACAGQTPSQIAEAMRQAELDPKECYRVRDVHFTRGDDLRFYLTDGYIVFGKPVGGRIMSAVFSADTEAGDAELIVMPPSQGERVSLAAFTESPNLDEHFKSALFLFSDDTAETLKKAIEQRGDVRKSAERGTLLAGDWNRILSNLANSFSVRLVQHLLAHVPAERGIFYAAVQGKALGNFDAVYDPDANEQIYLGQLKYKDGRAYYDTWAQFGARAFRIGARKPPGFEITAGNYRIEARLDADLHLKVLTKTTITASVPGRRVLAFEISEGMRVTAARLDGQPVELFTAESLRENLIRRSDSVLFLAIAPQSLEPGKSYEMEFEHEGDVVRRGARNVYFVSSRSNWYPRAGNRFSTFDIRFIHPNNLQIVFAGELTEDRVDGATHITRRVVTTPIRLAGFNLGQYDGVKQTRGDLTVEVFANKESEFARPALDVPAIQPHPAPRRGVPQQQQPGMALPQVQYPDAGARLQPLANEVAWAFEYLTATLGPPALSHLMVSPIPGTFGQGFPGLVYLSTISYLDPRDRPVPARDDKTQTFFSEILHAHETAHQWWGNVVSSPSMQDEWLLEALANYSALMVLEKKKGPKAAGAVLDGYRQELLRKGPDGKPVESVGPIRLGLRLARSQSPNAWNSIVYGKGSWIVHMLRKRMGDEQFLKMLGEICTKYRFQQLSVRQFEEIAAAHSPKGFAEPFFDQWVENTGIPALSMTQSYQAGKLTITVTQDEVDEKASFQVPVEVQIAKGKSQTIWVTTGSDPTTVTESFRMAPLKVTLDPENSVLRR